MIASCMLTNPVEVPTCKQGVCIVAAVAALVKEGSRQPAIHTQRA